MTTNKLVSNCFFLQGRLHKCCRAPDIPQETCFMGCKSYIKYVVS